VTNFKFDKSRPANVEKFLRNKVVVARRRPEELQPEPRWVRYLGGGSEPPFHQLGVNDFSLFWPLEKAFPE